MAPQTPGWRLSCIDTSWSTVYQAHQGQGDEVVSAQRQLLMRYYHPVARYLRALVRDAEAAEELTTEFAVRFLRGDFRRADPSRGRFRDLLKRSLRHLAIDHWRRKRVEKERTPIPFRDDGRRTPIPADWHTAPPPRRVAPDLDIAEADRTFLRGWRAEMLAQAWDGLARLEEQTRCSWYTVLRLQTDHPQARSADLARLVGARLGKPLSEAAFRQLLCRARDKFADFLVDAVARSLATPDPDAVAEELIELDLLSYCRRSLARLRQG